VTTAIAAEVVVRYSTGKEREQPTQRQRGPEVSTMYDEYTLERFGKDKVTGWLQEAEADRRVMLATAGQRAGGVRELARKLGALITSAVQSLLNPPATPLDIPFGHAG